MFYFESSRQNLPVFKQTFIYYTAMEDWTVLETYMSEAEARVAESFLRAQGLEVQLLDSHMNAYPPTSSTVAGRGMRLLVRSHELEHAREMMARVKRGSLEVVGDQQAPGTPETIWRKYEQPIFWITVIILLAVIASTF